MSLKNEKLFHSTWWSIRVPSAWTVTEDSDCVTISGEHSRGALQISAARKEHSFVTDEDLQDFANERRTVGPDLLRCNLGSLSGFYLERVIDGVFWREWWLRSGSLLVYVSYNVDEGFRDTTYSVIDQTIQTLKPKADSA